MGIRESALSTLSALTNNDFIRMVSSAGASRKATLQSIAQHIIEQYAGSSLLGKQQSVKSALDELNSTLTAKDITNSLSSSVATINRALAQRIGNVVVVQVRFTLTSAVTPTTDVISGFDRSMGNYVGINTFRLYDNTTGAFINALVTHPDGAGTVEVLRIMDNVANGHLIRGTFVYLAQ